MPRPGDFFHHNRVAQIAQIAAAVFLGHGHAQQTQFAELWPHIHGELVVAVDLSGSGCEFLLTELVDRIPEHIQLFTQSVVERGVGVFIQELLYLGCGVVREGRL